MASVQGQLPEALSKWNKNRTDRHSGRQDTKSKFPCENQRKVYRTHFYRFTGRI